MSVCERERVSMYAKPFPAKSVEVPTAAWSLLRVHKSLYISGSVMYVHTHRVVAYGSSYSSCPHQCDTCPGLRPVAV